MDHEGENSRVLKVTPQYSTVLKILGAQFLYSLCRLRSFYIFGLVVGSIVIFNFQLYGDTGPVRCGRLLLLSPPRNGFCGSACPSDQNVCMLLVERDTFKTMFTFQFSIVLVCFSKAKYRHQPGLWNWYTKPLTLNPAPLFFYCPTP